MCLLVSSWCGHHWSGQDGWWPGGDGDATRRLHADHLSSALHCCLWSQWTVKFEFCGVGGAGGQQEVAVSHLVAWTGPGNLFSPPLYQPSPHTPRPSIQTAAPATLGQAMKLPPPRTARTVLEIKNQLCFGLVTSYPPPGCRWPSVRIRYHRSPPHTHPTIPDVDRPAPDKCPLQTPSTGFYKLAP